MGGDLCLNGCNTADLLLEKAVKVIRNYKSRDLLISEIPHMKCHSKIPVAY